MLLFVDDSGIHKATGYSAFAVVAIARSDYETFEKNFLKIEKELRIDVFHWAETSWPVKEKFLTQLAKLDFQTTCGVIQNPIHPEKELERMLPRILPQRKFYAMYIDGKKSKSYERRMKKSLRDQGIATKKLVTVNDKQFAGVRVADAVAGLIRTAWDRPNDKRIQAWYKRFRKKIGFVLEQNKTSAEAEVRGLGSS
jgi:hypothetical protein